MITLFLDTSTSKLIVSLYQGNECICLKNVDISNDLSSKVLPLIKLSLDESNLMIDDIKKIIVVNGPGSFTGVRVGVTIAKTLAWAKDIDINTVSSLEVIATTKIDTKYIIPLIDARRDAFYAAMYDKNSNNIIEECYITRTDLMNKIKRHTSLNDVTFVSYDDISDLDIIKPNLELIKIIKKYTKSKTLNPHSVNPNYLKKVEAEEKLNDKGN